MRTRLAAIGSWASGDGFPAAGDLAAVTGTGSGARLVIAVLSWMQSQPSKSNEGLDELLQNVTDDLSITDVGSTLKVAIPRVATGYGEFHRAGRVAGAAN